MPMAADALAAQQVQDRLKSLHGLVHEIEKKRKESEEGILSLQQCIFEEKSSSSQGSQKLKTVYRNVVAQAEAEEDVIRTALQKINEIRNIRNERRIQAKIASNKASVRKGIRMKLLSTSAQTLPLYVGKIDEKPPPLCGAIPADPNYVAKIRNMVAALVKDNSDEENWILAEVASYNSNTGKYEVDDVLKEANQKGRHTLSRRKVIPLPLMRANPETDPQALFQPGTFVLALFPQTTCFYKALVSRPPSNHTDEYELLFEDLTYPGGYSPPHYVVQRYVIPYKQKTKQTTS